MLTILLFRTTYFINKFRETHESLQASMAKFMAYLCHLADFVIIWDHLLGRFASFCLLKLLQVFVYFIENSALSI